MILKATSMALAESAIEVLYRGKKKFATIVIDADGGADYSPLISLGVSDTSLAQAVTNKVTAFTGASTSTIKDLIVAIQNASGGTIGADTEINVGDFDCRIKNALPTDAAYSASAAQFVDAAGTTTNLSSYKGGWFQTLVWDNDAASTGHVTLRIPTPAEGQGPVAIRLIQGVTTQSDGTTAITSGLTRTIYNADGTTFWTITDATPTSAEMKFDLSEPIVFDGPVIIRDTGATASEVDATSTIVAWGYPPNVI